MIGSGEAPRFPIELVPLNSTLLYIPLRKMTPKHKILLIGSGGIGTVTAYALETGGLAEVTAILRSNYAVVEKNGFTIDSVDHGYIQGWRPSHSTYFTTLYSKL